MACREPKWIELGYAFEQATKRRVPRPRLAQRGTGYRKGECPGPTPPGGNLQPPLLKSRSRAWTISEMRSATKPASCGPSRLATSTTTIDGCLPVEPRGMPNFSRRSMTGNARPLRAANPQVHCSSQAASPNAPTSGRVSTIDLLSGFNSWGGRMARMRVASMAKSWRPIRNVAYLPAANAPVA